MLKKLLISFLVAGCVLTFAEIGLAQGSYHYIGSKKGNRYHNPKCRIAQKIPQKNKVVFGSVQGAQDKGYIPCEYCKPPEKD